MLLVIPISICLTYSTLPSPPSLKRRSSSRLLAPRRLQVKWGQDKTGDSAKRSLAKAVLWRVFAASNTLICGVFLAKDLSVASKIAGTDTIFKTVSTRPRAGGGRTGLVIEDGGVVVVVVVVAVREVRSRSCMRGLTFNTIVPTAFFLCQRAACLWGGARRFSTHHQAGVRGGCWGGGGKDDIAKADGRHQWHDMRWMPTRCKSENRVMAALRPTLLHVRLHLTRHAAMFSFFRCAVCLLLFYFLPYQGSISPPV